MATKWGIVSAGKISHDFCTGVGTLSKSEHKLVAVAARDLSRAKEFAKLHGMDKAYGTYEELANDKDIEVVYIGSLNPSHFEHVKMMLNAGKHVLCEKPLTINLKLTKELIDLAKSKKRFLMEAIWSRCFPSYDTLRNEIAKKSIGEIKQVIVPFGFKIADVERVNQKKMGGGSILDLGVYAIQFASLVYNHEKPTLIKAVGHLNKEGCDMSMSASMTYTNGRTATILTHCEVELTNEAVVIGTQGTIRIPQFWCPPKIVLANGEVKEVPLPKPKLTLNFINSTGLGYEAAEVRDCIKKGLLESPKVAHAHSLLIAEIEDEIRRQVGVVFDADK